MGKNDIGLNNAILNRRKFDLMPHLTFKFVTYATIGMGYFSLFFTIDIHYQIIMLPYFFLLSFSNSLSKSGMGCKFFF